MIESISQYKFIEQTQDVYTSHRSLVHTSAPK